VKSSYIRTLSRSVQIFVPSTRKALTTHLNRLESDVSELTYKSWVLETFVIGINEIYSAIVDLSTEAKKKKAKESLFKAVIKHNPLLDPDNIFIDGGGLTFTKTGNPITESGHWNETTDESNLPMIADFHKYFELSRSAREHDHEIETVYSSPLNLGIKVRVFPKKYKNNLVFGLDPKTKQQLEFYVINICIDSFHDVYNLLQSSNEVPIGSALTELYNISIEHNPFLDISLRQLKRINQSLKTHRHAIGGDHTETTKLRKSLNAVPKTDILNLEKNLLSSIYGQDDPVRAVSDSFKRAVSGIKNPKIPIGAFLFYGETSTGKTEIARTVAKLLTKGDKGLLKISCNTLQHSHSLSTLIGSPPGYVGSDDNGCLANGLEDSPFKVVLFDEVDKAHKNIYNLLLEMLEEGKIMVANGEVLDFSQCLIIFTSNMGQHEGQEAANTAGFSSGSMDKEEIKKQVAKKTLEKVLTPEFRARLTGEFYFKALEYPDLIRTAHKYMEERVAQLKSNKINLTYDQALINVLYLEQGKADINPRTFNNEIEQKVFRNLGDYLIENDLIDNRKTLNIHIDKDINFSQFENETVKKSKTKKATK
jgi:ATP-dependent Clp protease ATP-binding subunit ClpA